MFELNILFSESKLVYYSVLLSFTLLFRLFPEIEQLKRRLMETYDVGTYIHIS